MTAAWSENQPSGPFGGYDSWEQLHPDPVPAGKLALCRVFARLLPDLEQSIAALVADPAVGYDAGEAHRLWALQDFLANGGSPGNVPEEERRFVLLIGRSDVVSVVAAGLLEVLHLGPPLFLSSVPKPALSQQPAVSAGAETVLVGLIDDSLPFLHRRFARADGHSRFQAVWLQAPREVEDPNQTPPGLPPADLGARLDAAAVDALIASSESETTVYRRFVSWLSEPGERRSSTFAWAHGALVADLACGADPGGLDQVAVIGVQLPARAFRQTSGREVSASLVQGIRWLCDQAIARGHSGPASPPLIVNVSLGVLAGPKDGSGFVESWLDGEISRYRSRTGGAPIRIVLAYGNAYRTRQVAAASLAPQESLALDWRLQADDLTDSFVELRCSAPGDLRLSLSPPGLSLPELTLPTVGSHHLLDLGAGPLAAIYREADTPQGRASLLVALLPTKDLAGGPTGPLGAWRLTLRNDGTGTAKVSLQIQRDDTPRGYRNSGRQSYFDHPDQGSPDPDYADYSGLGSSPLTRHGTHSAFASLAEENASAYCVGAGRCAVSFDLLADHGGVAQPPARYTAAGTANGLLSQSEGPQLAAFGDEGRLLSGRLANGLLNRSVARLSGTSAAAPQLVRALVQLAIASGGLANLAPGNTAGRNQEIALLLAGGLPAEASAEARLGAGLVPPG